MNVYQENGYDDRMDYLLSMAQDYDVHPEIVLQLADILGPNEDFDGLITSLREYSE